MTIFLVGWGLVIVGVVLNVVGWRMVEGKVKGVPDSFLEWLLEVFKKWFGLLTDRHSRLGERIAALGAITAAIGLVTVVAGLIAWAN